MPKNILKTKGLKEGKVVWQINIKIHKNKINRTLAHL
jgi:hypothetical protein